jgi:hypothetical protein
MFGLFGIRAVSGEHSKKRDDGFQTFVFNPVGLE